MAKKWWQINPYTSNLYGIGEAGLGLGGSLATESGAGLAGIAGLLAGASAEERARIIEEARKQSPYLYEPTSDEGQGIMQSAAYLMSPVQRLGDWLANASEQAGGSPGAMTAARMIPDAALALAGLPPSLRAGSALSRGSEALTSRIKEIAGTGPGVYRAQYGAINPPPGPPRISGVVNQTRTGVGRAKNRVGKTGQYVGAPIGVDSPQALGTIRQNYQDAAVRGVAGRDWYDDASQFVQRVAPPGMEQAIADTLAVTSANTSVNANLGFTVKGANQIAAGDPVSTGRFPIVMAPLIEDVMQGNRTHLGPKRQPFADNLSVAWRPQMQSYPVHDIWDGRAWGYVDANGKPWDAGFSPAQHSFMDQQANFVIDRMNKNNAGGFSNWNPLNSQAAAWTGAKIASSDISPSDAAKSYGDFAKRYEATSTSEQVPGVGTGQLEGLADLPYEARSRYSDMASWRNEKNQDSIYAGAGMLTEPNRRGIGAFTPASGVVEFNPLEVGRPLVTSDAGMVRPSEARLMDIAESSRAYVDAQNAGAWHKIIPDTQAPAGKKTSLVIPVDGPVGVNQMSRLHQIAQNNGFFAVDGGDGTVRFINDVYSDIGGTRTGEALGKELKKGQLGSDLSSLGLTAERAKIQPGYMDYEGAWKAGVGSDTATKQFLNELDTNPTYAGKIEPALRAKAAANYSRDKKFASETGLKVREDIQTARQILATSGVQGLRDAVGKGILPAAIVASVLGSQRDQRRTGVR